MKRLCRGSKTASRQRIAAEDGEERDRDRKGVRRRLSSRHSKAIPQNGRARDRSRARSSRRVSSVESTLQSREGRGNLLATAHCQCRAPAASVCGGDPWRERLGARNPCYRCERVWEALQESGALPIHKRAAGHKGMRWSKLVEALLIATAFQTPLIRTSWHRTWLEWRRLVAEDRKNAS